MSINYFNFMRFFVNQSNRIPQKISASLIFTTDSKQYLEGARDFFANPPAGTLTKLRPNGDTLFYNPASNTFGVEAAGGVPRTLFRPTDGINYWNKL